MSQVEFKAATSVPAMHKVQPVTRLSSGFLSLLRRDLLMAFRQRHDLVNPVFFFVMVVSLFPLGLGPEKARLAEMAPGVLWIAALLSTLLTADGLFKQDAEDGALDLMLCSPHPLFLLVLGKLIAHWLTTALPLLLMTPVLAMMLYLDLSTLRVVMLGLALGTPVVTVVSAIGAALTVGLNKGGVLIAIIALPLYVPVLIFGVGAATAASAGMAYGGQLATLAAMLLLAVTFAPFAIAAGLRISIHR
jgi:heme exporter protein B